MMIVHEVSKLTGVSIRTLQYYDKIGLLHPTGYTDAGYRLYDAAHFFLLFTSCSVKFCHPTITDYSKISFYCLSYEQAIHHTLQ